MPKCILIVEDDPGTVQVIKHTIQAKGYEALSAPDGLAALEILKGKIPDLILLDVQMPKMDGYGFIMAKSKIPTIKSIPVIVLTSMEKTEPLFKRHGVKAYLLKPLDPHILLEKIQAIVPA